MKRTNQFLLKSSIAATSLMACANAMALEFPQETNAYVSPSVVDAGDSVTVHWDANNEFLVSCDLSGLTGNLEGFGPSGSRSFTPQQSGTVTVTCGNGSWLTASDTFNITVNQADLEVSAYWSPTSVAKGDNSTFNWDSENADTCSVTGAVTGSGRSGNRSYSSYSAGDYYATVKCTQGNQTKTKSAKLTVLDGDLPTVNAYYNPSILNGPGTTRLIWSSSNANSCSYDNKNVATSGSEYMYVKRTQYTTVSCTGAGGTNIDLAVVSIGGIIPPHLSPTQSASKINALSKASSTNSSLESLAAEQGLHSAQLKQDLQNTLGLSATTNATDMLFIDMNNDNIDDLFVIDKQSSTGYILFNNAGKFDAINKVVRNINSFSDVENIAISNNNDGQSIQVILKK